MKAPSVIFAILLLAAVSMAQGQNLPSQPGELPAASPPTATTAAPTPSDANAKVIPSGAKVFVQPAEDNLDQYLKTAFQKKKVPVEVVDDKSKADYEITAHSSTQKAGAAKIILLGSWHSREEASIQITNLRSGIVAYAYSYHTDNSAHGKQTSAESCAKHLKNKIEGRE